MEQNRNIKELSVVELKALAYDQLIAIEGAQKNLKIINGELVSRAQPPVEKRTEDEDNVQS